MERLYHCYIVRRHPKTGERIAHPPVRMTGEPVTHAEAMTMKSKWSPHTTAAFVTSWEIEEVTSPILAVFWERCFIVEEDDFDLPEGWVRIERCDQIDAPGLEPYDCDEDAALDACRLARAPGVAMYYAPAAGIWEAVGDHVTTVRWAELDRAATALSAGHAEACPKWIVMIPVIVAKAVGLMH